VAVGGCSAIEQEDYITSTHRAHAHSIAKGLDPNRMMAELFGKKTGNVAERVVVCISQASIRGCWGRTESSERDQRWQLGLDFRSGSTVRAESADHSSGRESWPRGRSTRR
jgi:hypothetical protein